MPRHIEAYINGVALTDAVPRALIQQVQQEAAETDLTTADHALGDGLTLVERRRTRLTVAVEFALAELFDLPARAAMQQEAAAWAQDGVLRLSDHPGQHLNVICTKRPALGETRSYTTVLRAEFAAIAPPYWQDDTYVTVTDSGESGAVALRPTGTADKLPLEAEITPTGGTLDELEITCEGTAFALSGLNVPQGTPLVIGYDSRGHLAITAGGNGKLRCRSAQSSDRLLATPGLYNTITYQADTECDCIFKTRGLYV